MRSKASYYCAVCGSPVRRRFLGSTQRLLRRNCSHYLLRHHLKENKNVCRGSGAVCNGASCLPPSNCVECSAQHVGERLVLYQEGRNRNPAVHYFIWFTSSFGFVDGHFGMVEDLSDGILASIGQAIAWIFAPLGWGNWQAAVAAITGLVAKENVVGTFGILYGFAEVAEDGSEIWGTLAQSFTAVSAYSFLVFNLLCAPCFAAIGAIKREMNNARWTWFAIGYQTILAYVVALCIYQFGRWFTEGTFGVGTVAAIGAVAVFIYLLVRPYKEGSSLNVNVKAKTAS